MSDKLAEAIDSMKTTTAEKLDAIKGAIIDGDTDIAKKLATIKALIKAQTVSFESKMDILIDAVKDIPDYGDKLDAIKNAIEALPDYGDKLDAIKNAIEALPDYGEKIDAIVDALDAIKTQMGEDAKVQSDIKSQVESVVKAIGDLAAEVKSGNKDSKDALAEIVKKLDALKTSVDALG
jgi:hypothetical protein